MNTLSKGPKPSTWFQLDKFGSSDPAYVSLDKNMYSETRPISGTIESLPEGYLFEVFDDSTLKYFYFDPSTMVSFPEKPLDSFVIPAFISKDFLASSLDASACLTGRELSFTKLDESSCRSDPLLSQACEANSLSSTQSEPFIADQASSDHIDMLKCLGSINKGRSMSLPSSSFFTSQQCILNGYALNFFSKTKKGFLLRTPVPLDNLTSWSAACITKPLTVLPREHHKNAIQCFKILQKLMGDDSINKQPISLVADGYRDLSFMLRLVLTNSELVDELYCQIFKQLYLNPSLESTLAGWKIVSVYVNTFCPSNNLIPYIFRIIEQASSVPSIQPISEYCHKKLTRLNAQGSKMRVPSPMEVCRYLEAPYYTGYFEESLTNIMQLDRQKKASIQVPLIFSFLKEALVKLNAGSTEGIFRIPGDAETIAAVKLVLDRGQFDEVSFKDPAVPASLLKLWLRELEEPLVPLEYYEECLTHSANWSELSKIIERFPEDNQKLIRELVAFLCHFLTPESSQKTKMTIDSLSVILAPSFLRCPSNDPLVIIKNSKFQQSVVKMLLQNHSA